MYFSCTGGTDSNDHDFYVDDFSMRTEPGPPQGLMATGLSHQRADLAWLDCLGETGYTVQRKSGSTWPQAGTTGTNICGYSDTGRDAATTYHYRVIASNDLGPSEPSGTGTAVTSPALPVATGTPKDHLAAAVARTGSGASERLIPGRYFTYDHDGIGNREWAVLGGGVKTDCAANAMNQLTSRTSPGVTHLSGYADPGHCVQVSYGGTTWAPHRDGGYYFAAVGVDNASGPVAAEVTVSVLDADGNTVSSEEIPRLVPKASETNGGELSYDGRGNKTSDSIWEYTWDGLDRMSAVQTCTAIPADDRVKVTFAYDYAGRRASKTVYAWDDQAEDWSATPESVRKFIWSGWLLQAETNGDDKMVRSYVWGRDVSGLPGGAAGIGGLLAVRHHNAATGAIEATYWVVPDEHGSVTSLVKVDGSGRQVVASFAYSPFGAVLAADGKPGTGVSLADPTALCPFLYSTKYYDKETALYYYGYRYLNPATGRWLNRDPIAEDGGLNLYAFCVNDPVNCWDRLGDDWYEVRAKNVTTGRHRKTGKKWVKRRYEFVFWEWSTWHWRDVNRGVVGSEDIWMPEDNIQVFDKIMRQQAGFATEIREAKAVVNRIEGGVQLVGGVAEGVAGAAAAVIPEPASTAGGVLLMGLGADTASTGLKKLVSGEHHDTLTYSGIRQQAERFLSPETAHTVASYGETALHLAGGAAAAYGAHQAVTKQLSNPLLYEATTGAPATAYWKSTNQPLQRSAPNRGAKYVYDARVGRYRDVATGRFAAARDLPWPKNAGFAQSTPQTVRPGTILDRYGSPSGRFLGEPGASVSARGMAAGTEGMPYSQYRVLKPFEAQVGPAAAVPDFGATGGATQYLPGKSVQWLLDNGFLEAVK